MKTKMMKHLNQFSVVLQIFGFQYFSLEQLRKQSDVDKFPSFGYSIYFLILIVSLPHGFVKALHSLLLLEDEDEKIQKNLDNKSIFEAAIGLLMHIGFVFLITLSVANFYLRTKSLKKIYFKIFQIEEIYKKNFNKSLSCKKVQRFVLKRIALFQLMILTFVVLRIIKTGKIDFRRIFDTLFFTFWYLLAIYYIFFVKLINFQIEMVSLTIFECCKNLNEFNSHKLTEQLLMIKKILVKIKECAELIDRIMMITVLGLFIINTTISISHAYRIFLVLIGVHNSDIKRNRFKSKL